MATEFVELMDDLSEKLDRTIFAMYAVRPLREAYDDGVMYNADVKRWQTQLNRLLSVVPFVEVWKSPGVYGQKWAVPRIEVTAPTAREGVK